MSMNTAKNDQMKYAEYLQQMINGVDVARRSKWEDETRKVSANIRIALKNRIAMMPKNNSIDDKFFDYCNAVKGLLALYNFGNLDTEESLAAKKATEDEIAKCRSEREKDKELIKYAIKKIIDHVNEIGFDITPALDRNACDQIFVKDAGEKMAPITISAATVFTTLVYFRRSVKRIKLFTEEELVLEDADLNKLTVQTIGDIMYLFYAFAYDETDTKNEAERFTGWGATLDKRYTKMITLSDTYAVIDALSRYADAFTQKDENKKDIDFTNDVDDYVKSVPKYNDLVKSKELNSITDRCLGATYKTALNVYDTVKNVYGKSAFYPKYTVNEGKNNYEYLPTSYDQIASSSRSSALFYPLYVAMITMYGYTDKEVVIRRFMDDYDLAETYYTRYETKCPEDKVKISDFAKSEEISYDGDFDKDKELITQKHEPMSKNYQKSGDDTWRDYYKISRIFQKYLEIYHPEELMKIAEYRDYLNYTKDAIDQVQILYRQFSNKQRLGVVDTDYAMYTLQDVALTDDDAASIAKLNKANIALNNLRPMLLSSKIMIVRALTQYPQADIRELYNSIEESRYKSVSKKRKNTEVDDGWMWNEDAPDMNSTARHCEAITYDYFNYYENYELDFKSMQTFRNEISEIVRDKAKNNSDGSIGTEEEIKEVGQELGDFGYFILELTRQNVELVKVEYKNKLRDKEKTIAELEAKAKEDEAQVQKKLEELEKKYEEKIAALQDSYMMGETIKGWINKGVEEFLTKNLSMAIINILNGNRKTENFDLRKIIKDGKEEEEKIVDTKIVDAQLPMVGDTWQAILKDCAEDRKDPKKYDEKIDKYNQMFKKVIDMMRILGAASNGILESKYYKDLSRDTEISFETRSDKINTDYEHQKEDGVPKNMNELIQAAVKKCLTEEKDTNTDNR